ncbi:TonB-dependent receptor [Shewanella sp. KX20019]|nr:TonB-dependent receptor [Shewanella sp. KX20019]
MLPLSAIASAETPSDIDTGVQQIMERMVVTASGHEQSINDAPASISVIDRQEIENRAYKDLTDALKDIPGVTVTGGGARQDISVRGMPAEYTALLVDGKKQSGRETQPSGSGGFEQDWLPPLEAIERIEVIRGPMSTLYGSDAMGGVINIITKKDYQQWQGNLRVEATVQENQDSGNYYQGQLYVAGPIIPGLLSASLSSLYQDRVEDDIERGYGEKQLKNYRGSVHLSASEQDQFSFDFTKQEQTRISTSGKSLPESSKSTQTDNNRNSMSLTHRGDYDWGTATSYLQSESVENVGRAITTDNVTFNTQWSLPLDAHLLSVGATLESEDLQDNQETIENKQWSVFAEDEWWLTDNFTLTMGLRFDNNEQFDTHLSPRVYGVWTVNDNWTLKTGISTGYRAPDLRDMSQDWVQESRGGDIYGNPDLKPEISVNTEMGIYYLSDNDLSSSLTVFHNDFSDKINLVNCPMSVCGAEDTRHNVNIDDAITYGAEFTLAKSLTDDISFNASYAYTYSEQKTGDNQGLPLTQIPLHLFTANSNWAIDDDTNVWLRASYRGKESQASTLSSRAVQAPSATYVDLGGNWQATTNIKLMFGIYNLLDKQVTYEEYGYVEDGRRYWIAAETKF